MPDAPRKMGGPQRRITKANWRELIVLAFLHAKGPKNRRAIGARLGLDITSLDIALRALHARKAVALDHQQWAALPTPYQRIVAELEKQGVAGDASALAEIMMETQPDAPSAFR